MSKAISISKEERLKQIREEREELFVKLESLVSEEAAKR